MELSLKLVGHITCSPLNNPIFWNPWKEIAISEDLCNTLQKEMIENEQYASIIKEGAKIIETMEFN